MIEPMLKSLFTVVVNRDDTVSVVSAMVVKETPQYYFIDDTGGDRDWNDPRRFAFGYSIRIPKGRYSESERAALEGYVQLRQRDKATAESVIAQATRQIASANELLMNAGVDLARSL